MNGPRIGRLKNALSGVILCNVHGSIACYARYVAQMQHCCGPDPGR